MPYEDFKLPSTYDGLELRCRTWMVPVGEKPRARIVFVHGFSEFVDAYDEWFPPVSEAGYEVTLYDARGHGKTAQKTSDYGKANEKGVMCDLETVIQHVIDHNNGGSQLPLILWGFSMGGAIVLNYMVIGTHREEFSAYIATGPMILRAEPLLRGLNGLKARLLPWLVPFIPNHCETVPIPPEWVNNNPERHAKYPLEEMRHYRSSVIFMHDAIKRGERLLDPEFNSGIVDRPLLINHGTADVLCDHTASAKFIAEIPVKDKTLELYGDKPHELMQNVQRDVDEHRDKVLAWLDSRIPKLN